MANIAEQITGKVVAGIEWRTFFNDEVGSNWSAECIVFTDGTYLAMCSDDLELILRDKE